MEITYTSKKWASAAAYSGALLFALLVVLFSTDAPVFAISIVAVVFHIVLFPVVSTLPSPDWAKAAGYGWLILDIAANIMRLNNVDELICSALRYGAHIPAVIWIISSSLKCNRLILITGLLQSLIMGSYSFLAALVPMWYLFPAMILLIIWLILVGKYLSRIELKDHIR